MDASGTELADRVRALLGADGIEERRMFGSRAFLHGGKILVGARKGGVLLLRVEAEHAAELLLRPGVSRARMGGRSMSTNWLDVAPEVLADDAELVVWLDIAREDLPTD
ncbi:MAG: TfoX/Sxy family protein [Microbacterium sp.]|jgi:TfoX/Sxy family transcriptional regulator of competence genes|nr:TfoX/Sxy family protein [Microbacterium sp.]